MGNAADSGKNFEERKKISEFNFEEMHKIQKKNFEEM